MHKVWVAGSINMDVVATASRYPKIGETVQGREVFFFPGGKGANQAVSAAKLGAPTALIGKVGADGFGRELRSFLAAQGINLEFVQDTKTTHTGTAVITVANSDNAIVVVPGANATLTEDDISRPTISKGDVLVSQFEIPVSTVKAFFSRAGSKGAITILNPAPAINCGPDLLDLADVLILNETELAALSAREVRGDEPDEKILEIVRGLQTRPNQTVCVTLGPRGALALVSNKICAVRGRAVTAIDTTGAGDCFVGAVASQIANGRPIEEAFEYANLAASLCIQRMGAGPSMPTETEVAALQRH